MKPLDQFNAGDVSGVGCYFCQCLCACPCTCEPEAQDEAKYFMRHEAKLNAAEGSREDIVYL